MASKVRMYRDIGEIAAFRGEMELGQLKTDYLAPALSHHHDILACRYPTTKYFFAPEFVVVAGKKLVQVTAKRDNLVDIVHRHVADRVLNHGNSVSFCCG